jgi:hypothetical protein
MPAQPRVSVRVTDPSVSLSCSVQEAIVADSRSRTRDEILAELLTAKPIKKKGGPGIELLLNQQLDCRTMKRSKFETNCVK